MVNFDRICIEYFKFDSQKALDPNIIGVGYQQGRQKNFENVKAYVRDRDEYTCQLCGAKDTMLHVHHLVERSKGGSDRPDNLITMCVSCHDKIHLGKAICPQITATRKFRDSGVLNSVMPTLYNQLTKSKFQVTKTFGSYTKTMRNRLGIAKGHREDAFCAALTDQEEINLNSSKEGNVVNFQQFRRHNRSWTNQIKDRKYYMIDGRKVIARNRNRRSGQDKKKDISLTEFRQLCRAKGIYVPLIAKAGGRVTAIPNDAKLDKKSDWQFRQGNQIVIDGVIKTVHFQATTQRRVYFFDGETSQKTKDHNTFAQIRKRGRHLTCNSGLVSV